MIIFFNFFLKVMAFLLAITFFVVILLLFSILWRNWNKKLTGVFCLYFCNFSAFDGFFGNSSILSIFRTTRRAGLSEGFASVILKQHHHHNLPYEKIPFKNTDIQRLTNYRDLIRIIWLMIILISSPVHDLDFRGKKSS